MIARRLPVRVRPVFFGLGWLLLGFGLALGLNLDWDLSLFTGNVLLQIAAGDLLLRASPGAFSFLVLAVIGLASLAWSFTLPRGQTVFYPLAALLGIFVTIFGTTYLFDVSLSGEMTAAGSVLFVFFDYANLFHRPFQSAFGLFVLIIGLVILGRASFGRRGAKRGGAAIEAEFLPAEAPAAPSQRITPPATPRPTPRIAQNRAAGPRPAASARPRG